ncbi:GyrI-like domain-containing protein [Candidatus Protochlamydia phocaeensis]|uniref:GyrI-like domain-containing protein n=1 Tax=Candidatus Protochlamydia phocaeensis TaxID=1414722 RepID=UPI0008387685|nr:GyrI-like domain-containing protein [Candidatus Protochlamydia phocaeensis]
MKYQKVKVPAKHMIGIECRASNANPLVIAQHWERFYKEGVLSRIPDRLSEDVMALYCDYESDHTKPYSLVIGCEVSSLEKIPQGMVGKTVPASTYAVFTAKGAFPKAIIETWKTIWQTALKRTYTGDFEIYGSKYNSMVDPEMNISIAIRD